MKGEGNKERIKFGKLNVDFLVTPDGDLHFFAALPYLVSYVRSAIDIGKRIHPSQMKL